MLHLSKQGHSTSLKVTIGNNVMVNTLTSMTMIRPTKCSLDLEDDIIHLGILSAEPFPVTYKQTLAQIHVSMETIKACITQAFPMSM
jgi:hypothetical protein